MHIRKMATRLVLFPVLLLVVLLAGTCARAYATSGLTLPEGRQWELVSPRDKYGVGIELGGEGGGVTQAAASGDAITYLTVGSPVKEPAGNRAFEFSQILSRRGSSGWETADLSTPHDEAAGVGVGDSTEYKQFAEADLSRGLVEPKGDTPLSPLGAEAEKTIYLREGFTSSYTPLVTKANVLPEAKFGEPKTENLVEFDGGSPDMQHVVFSSIEKLTENAARMEVESAYAANLYEWNAGALSLVSVLPDGKAASEEGASAQLGLTNYLVRNAVSTDGSKVVFSTNENEHLYLRDTDRGETVQLDAVASGSGHGTSAPLFRGASADGSRIFFTDQQALTADSRAEEFEPDLYVYEVSAGAGPLSGTLTDLTKDARTLGGGPERGDVQGAPIGYGESGEYVYFVADGVLAEGATAEAPNLYVEHLEGGEGGTWTPTFIATLSRKDGADWDARANKNADLNYLSGRVSPSGEYLAFMSSEPLTGYDNHDAHSGERDEEVYEYDASTKQLVCASCDPGGTAPVGVLDTGTVGITPGPLFDRTETWTEGRENDPWIGGYIAGWTPVDLHHALYQPRSLLDSGQLFFDSPGDLVPGAGNEKMDVYQYRPAGRQCSSVTQGQDEVYKQEGENAGCVSLLSGGESGEESVFLDASESGEDVFFLTEEQLAAQDTDTSYDVYDAHVCSGEAPCPSPVSVPPACTNTESCRAAAPPQPGTFGAPTSATFSGQGNATPAPAAPAAKTKAKPLTRAQKLSRALKVCKRDKRKAKRASCEKSARAKYGPLKKRVESKKGSE